MVDALNEMLHLAHMKHLLLEVAENKVLHRMMVLGAAIECKC